MVLFYTDGDAHYPRVAMESLRNCDQKSKIAFYALSQEANPTVLHCIARDIQQYGTAEVRNSVSPDMLVDKLPEVLNSMFHKVM